MKTRGCCRCGSFVIPYMPTTLGWFPSRDRMETCEVKREVR
jgi:hypothetical protein